MTIVLLAVAGATGAVVRFVLDSIIKSRWKTTFPWATFAINVSGSLLIGLVAGIVLFHSGPGDLQTIVGTGFCGGYTTFSTASFETVRLVEQRRRLLALTNALTTMVASIAACSAGLAIVYAL
ncbi:chromosome condensation protein CrcB [Rhodococcus sp. 1163]|uniref:fluoride efflux transporter CrcB n=1 Tax=Rhodococcus sp. 1163 TaxID=1905289 RepID=UPI0009FDB745|nr:fluoride efflux transporter CrcB [Rhodococcus sp. 1163]ORI19530.1 chromosome condensation protein CrcB [Rhodococcus sp. 1163]